MLFRASAAAGIGDGSITLTFRRWRRPQAVVGHRYRTPGGMIEVDAVDAVDLSSIGDADARRAGFTSAAALLDELGDAGPVTRVRFHHVGGDPRHGLAADDHLDDAALRELDRRLARLDGARTERPWTQATLDAIAVGPGVRAADLATALGRSRDELKRDVRKLKALGLTESLEVGYRLSPRGRAYLERRPSR